MSTSHIFQLVLYVFTAAFGQRLLKNNNNGVVDDDDDDDIGNRDRSTAAAEPRHTN